MPHILVRRFVLLVVLVGLSPAAAVAQQASSNPYYDFLQARRLEGEGDAKGAVAALLSGKSLLAAGVKRVSGSFSRGDTVAIVGPDEREIARGLVAYDAADAVKIAGLKSAEIAPVLGYAGRSAMVHRDDLVMGRTAMAELEAGAGG